MKLDILAFGAHPDDVELACGGTLAKLVQKGYKVGVVDLTRGEMGTRGSAEIRDAEAKNASRILGLSLRENLEMQDCLFQIDNHHILRVAAVIRKYQPEIVLANALNDRHVDHGKAAELVHQSYFVAGIQKVVIDSERVQSSSWRPKGLFHYIQDYYIEPSFCVDITNQMDLKMQSILAYKSQFYDPESAEPATRISGKDFLDFIKGRALEMGRMIHVNYGEGFVSKRPLDPAILQYFTS